MIFSDLLAFVYLFLFSLYHVVQGAISVFFSDYALKFNEFLYGFHSREKKQLKMTLKPWGSFSLAIGVIGFLVFFNLEKYHLILIGFILLLLLRAGYRILLRKKLYSYWKASPSQNWRMIIIQLIGIILFILFIIKRI